MYVVVCVIFKFILSFLTHILGRYSDLDTGAVCDYSKLPPNPRGADVTTGCTNDVAALEAHVSLDKTRHTAALFWEMGRKVTSTSGGCMECSVFLNRLRSCPWY